jgi:hypothetical protein
VPAVGTFGAVVPEKSVTTLFKYIWFASFERMTARCDGDVIELDCNVREH